MQYLMRVDYHEDDLGPLLTGALQPFVERQRRHDPDFRLSYKTHWLQGQHLLIGFAKGTEIHGPVVTALAEQFRTWIDTHPSISPPDDESYLRLSKKLAALEGVERPLGPIASNNTITLGAFDVPLFQDDAALSELRDMFISNSLKTLFRTIERRIQSPSDSLVEIIRSIVMIERMSPRAHFSYWPISIKAQVASTAANLASVDQHYAAISARIVPRLVGSSEWRFLRDVDAIIDDADAAWLATIEDLALGIRRYFLSLTPEFVSMKFGRDLRDNAEGALGLNKEQIEMLASDLDYQAYRAFINMFYMLFPLAGFTAAQRLLACRLIADILDTLAPTVVARARRGAADLVQGMLSG